MSLRSFFLLLLPCLAVAAAAAGGRTEPCNGGVCDAGEDETAALLQSSVAKTALPPSSSAAQEKTHVTIRRATVRKSISMSDVWDQLTGSVQIDELKQTVENAVGENKEKLLAELDKLEKAYPAAAEVKQKFLDQWDKIVSAVNLDEVKKQVAECTADVAACVHDNLPDGVHDKLHEVQDKMEDALKAHGATLDGIKKQAEEFWNKIQLELPDMDDLKSQVAEYGDQAKAAWEEFKETHDISSLADAAGSIINNAFGTVSGWFR
mmetsp:Transcript_95697/g.270792  ORF Transcript_95697/g.270792 Transcript_95697/m.270792 type:complete len:264 (+) Transcript_95697:82-873(+)